MNKHFVEGEPASIIINEVMYDPLIDDNFNEWIELYNPTNHSINITGWSISDNHATDFLEGDFLHGNGSLILPPQTYAIVAHQNTTIYETLHITNTSIKLYVDDNDIGNGLGNTQDRILLKDKNGTVIDAIEWGHDYIDIPGKPIESVTSGHTLSRYFNIDTDNTTHDFFDGEIPTPGAKNIFKPRGTLNITVYPRYIPKILNNSEYSTPFSIHITITDFSPNETYNLKAYITGDNNSVHPGSQTWDGTTWKYSNLYVLDITTDAQGKWTGWMTLRLCKNYKEYHRHIEKNYSAYLKIKVKKNEWATETTRQIHLLDMDESTSNATKGGYLIGQMTINESHVQNKVVIIENETGVITGCYFTENNGIDEKFPSETGYYKIASPVGTNYTLTVIDKTGATIKTISDISIKQGTYGVKLHTPETEYYLKHGETLHIPLIVKNTGDFNDTINLTIDSITNNWQASFEKTFIHLRPKQLKTILLHITPNHLRKKECSQTIIHILAQSSKDIGETCIWEIIVTLQAPDLTIPHIETYDKNGDKNSLYGEGEIIKIKGFLKNIGNENATNVIVRFYYDSIDEPHFLGEKHYDLVEKYQKYPSVKWDTHNVPPGNHSIIAIVDEYNLIDELDEHNNELKININIFETFPSTVEQNLLISEVYYHTHPGIHNEFITIYNPTNRSVNISGWYITNQPWKNRDDQPKIIFPCSTIIKAKESIVFTQNALDFTRETGRKPDFEYDDDADETVPQMSLTKNIVLSNNGGSVTLKDRYNHTIDVVIYGDNEWFHEGWNGSSIPLSGEGVILKRNDENGCLVDTNTSNDWRSPRRYGIGQSNFHYVTLLCHGEIIPFVSPDCSYKIIVNELRNARESVYLNMYEFTDLFLCKELIDVLKRNVTVNIFLEGSPVGGLSDDEIFLLNRIMTYGGNIRFIVNDESDNVYARYTFNHGKYMIIDNETVIVESCNWVKTGVPRDPTFGNREWGIIVKNETVAAYFQSVFLDDWNPQRCDSYTFAEMNFSLPFDHYVNKEVYHGGYNPQFESKTICGVFPVIPVFSPDTSYVAICNMIDSATESIYIEQLYIYTMWNEKINPFVERLVNKSKQGVDIKVIMNYNPRYKETNEKCNQTKQYLEREGIEVKFIYSNWSYFCNVHNKGMIVDNSSVLISSINWNENSITRNREAGIIIENEEIARYFTQVFFYDWNLTEPIEGQMMSAADENQSSTIYIVSIFIMTFSFIAYDWRKRKWQ